MTTKTDPFTTTENPLGAVTATWTTVTAAGLKDVNPGAKGSSSGTQDNVSMWAASNYSFLADQTSQATVSTLGNNDWPGAAVRLSTSSSGQGYIAYYRPEIPTISLYKLTAGTVGVSSNFILNVSATLVATDTFSLGVVGTTLTLYKNGISIGSVTDATYSSGQPGVAYQWANLDTSVITSWTGTDGGVSVTNSGLLMHRRNVLYFI